MRVETLTRVGAELGESPLWHAAEQVFYWVDIFGEKVYRFAPESAENTVVHDGEKVTALGELEGGGLVMVTPERLASFRSGEVETIATLSLSEQVRTNDGKCDPHGRMWFGTMDLETERPVGELFVCDDGVVHRVREDIILSNGLGWSPSGDVFYHVDSIRRLLYAYDYEPRPGTIDNGRVLVDMTGQPEVPDGLAIDVDGNIWVAMYGGWRIDVYDPSGSQVHTEPLDVQEPTSVAFGGEGLSELYVTTASAYLTPDELAGQPDAGDVLRLDPGVRGLEVGVFGAR